MHRPETLSHHTIAGCIPTSLLNMSSQNCAASQTRDPRERSHMATSSPAGSLIVQKKQSKNE
jgi:hypothetical protein